MRGLSRKIHSVEKGRVDDSQMSQIWGKIHPNAKLFLSIKKLQKASYYVIKKLKIQNNYN